MTVCIRVEYDKGYWGGEYSSVGDFALIPLSLIRAFGHDVEAAFIHYTGLSANHIVHYSDDELYNEQGDIIEEEEANA